MQYSSMIDDSIQYFQLLIKMQDKQVRFDRLKGTYFVKCMINLREKNCRFT